MLANLISGSDNRPLIVKIDNSFQNPSQKDGVDLNCLKVIVYDETGRGLLSVWKYELQQFFQSLKHDSVIGLAHFMVKDRGWVSNHTGTRFDIIMTRSTIVEVLSNKQDECSFRERFLKTDLSQSPASTQESSLETHTYSSPCSHQEHVQNDMLPLLLELRTLAPLLTSLPSLLASIEDIKSDVKDLKQQMFSLTSQNSSSQESIREEDKTEVKSTLSMEIKAQSPLSLKKLADKRTLKRSSSALKDTSSFKKVR
ncbi:hypothetical protein RCL1_001507 [Eukaryota sp. TZLM3-RCL]